MVVWKELGTGNKRANGGKEDVMSPVSYENGPGKRFPLTSCAGGWVNHV